MQAVGAQIGNAQQGIQLKVTMIEQLCSELRKDVSALSDCGSTVSSSRKIVQNIAVYVQDEAVRFELAFATFMFA